ncbi:PTS sugar transporter subunit IIC [Paraclostridium bifermentans]|uniref:PTS sugar transporter subunit IIC n=1 Tax=Paraclostridium bifermentans TaxID=1490 RepID=UPI000A16FFDE|nr:PTS transporter subunit EIIC [Paraclostridium bifermentans]OSB10025.1 PTS cellobiose transporter subunit IIC [Paraclostridium bifermentans]
MERFISFIEHYLVPITDKMGSQRHLVAIRDALIVIMPVTMIGAFSTLINNMPVQAYKDFMLKVFGDNWTMLGGNLWWGSIATMALFLVGSVAYFLAKSYKTNEIQAIFIALCSFLILSPQTASITPEGATDAVVGWGFISWTYLSTNALFTAILVGIVSTEIYVRLSSISWLRINLSDGVVPSVIKSFSTLLPGMITLFIIGLLSVLISMISDGKFINDIIATYLSKPLQGVGDTLFGAVMSALAINFLWIFGLHGSNITLSEIEGTLVQLGAQNVHLAQSGATEGYHVFAGAFLDAFVNLGGSGAILGLIIALIIAGRRRREMISLCGLGAIFNISEPIVFGMPIVLNPIYMVPFVLAPVMCTITSYIAISAGIVAPIIVDKIPWITPPIYGGLIATGHWSGAVLAIFNLLLSTVIYIPFIIIDEKITEKKILKFKKSN